jgi:hypothetical protein
MGTWQGKFHRGAFTGGWRIHPGKERRDVCATRLPCVAARENPEAAVEPDGPLHPGATRCTLPVGPEIIMEIVAQTSGTAMPRCP